MLLTAIAVAESGPDVVRQSKEPITGEPFQFHRLDRGFELRSSLQFGDQPVSLKFGNSNSREQTAPGCVAAKRVSKEPGPGLVPADLAAEFYIRPAGNCRRAMPSITQYQPSKMSWMRTGRRRPTARRRDTDL